MPQSEPTAAAIVAAFRDAGLEVVEMPGWAARCRCHTGDHQTRSGPTGRGWEVPQGVTIHHTGGPQVRGQAAVDYTNRILIAGNGEVPGPLCLAGVDADGRLLMVGAGRANHIGSISPKAASAIRNGGWPMSGYTDWRGSGVDGNSFTYGFEALAPMAPNAAQVEAMTIAAAALCRLLGIPAGAVHGHGEASSQRAYIDPGLDMGAFRRAVAGRLTAPVTAVTTPTVQEDSMPTPDDLWKAQLPNLATDKPDDTATAEFLLGQAARQGTLGNNNTKAVLGIVTAQSAQIAALTAAVGQLASGAGIDMAAIERAVHAAVADAIQSIDVTIKGA